MNVAKLTGVAAAAIGARFGIKTPLIVHQIVTFKCNLRCKYCGLWALNRREMSTAEIKRAMDEFSKAGTVQWHLTGGEALIRNDIGEIIDYGASKGMFVSLGTNGILVRNKLNDIKNLNLLAVSLDGPREIHDKIRGKGIFDKAVNGIKAAKSAGIDVHIVCVLSKLNMANNCLGIKGLFKIADELGVRVNFQPLYFDDYLNKKTVGRIYPKQSEYKNAIDLIKEYKSKSGNVVVSSTYLDLMKMANNNKKWNCYAGRLFMYLMPDGTVSPCWFKEKYGVSGLKEGFVNAFQKLPEMKGCRCGCFAQYNLAFSFDIPALLDGFKHLKMAFK